LQVAPKKAKETGIKKNNSPYENQKSEAFELGKQILKHGNLNHKRRKLSS